MLLLDPSPKGGLGIWQARKANTTLLGKLVWNLHQNYDKLWVDIIRSKYLGDSPFLFAPKKDGSFTWNSISKAKEVLREGFNFRLGNGESSIWYVPWASNTTRLSVEVLYVDIHDPALCIKDTTIDGNWNLNAPYTFLPPNIIEHISSPSPCIHYYVQYCFPWSDNLAGIYSATEGYKWLANNNHNVNTNNTDMSWNWIWQIPAP